MTEASFWRTIKDNILGAHFSRVENTAGSGIPDVNGCYMGSEIWLELKMFKSKQIQVRASQIAWMTRRIQAGGMVYVLARSADEIWVLEARAVAAMVSTPGMSRASAASKSMVITPPRTAALEIFSRPFEWDRIRDLIFFTAKINLRC